jgi:hypothetical protein
MINTVLYKPWKRTFKIKVLSVFFLKLVTDLKSRDNNTVNEPELLSLRTYYNLFIPSSYSAHGL